MSRAIKILLDLDGVLITNPSWKPDEIASDGYSKFNEACVVQFNAFLQLIDQHEVWLSSSRRTAMGLDDFNKVFDNRRIEATLAGYTPFIGDLSRCAEIEAFAKGLNEKELLIVDDDSSLHDLPESLKARWIPTNPFLGFTKDSIQKALEILR